MPETACDLSRMAPEAGWLSIREAATLEGVSRQAIQKRITLKKVPEGLFRGTPGAKGMNWQIHVRALSPASQEAHRRRQDATLDQRVETILQEQAAEPSPALSSAIHAASPKELRKAARKAALVDEFNGLPTKAEKVAYAKHHRVPLSSLYRWAARFDGTAASLIRSVADRRSSSYIQARQTAVDLYLRPEKPSPEQVYRALRATMGEGAPSRATVYRWLASEEIPAGMATYLRRGEKAYRDTCEPIRRRDWSRIPVNDTWVGDHHELDLLVILPDGGIGRPWLTAWQDAHSRALVGYTVNEKPNAMEIGLALRAGILPKDDEPFQGVPARVYVDNGKDYRSKLLNGTTVPVFRQEQADPVWGLFGHLGIKTAFCEPYHGKSKPVERLFGTLEKGWVCLMRGYCGRSPQYRPDQLEADVKATQLWLASGGLKGERRLMTWWEMEVEIAEAIRAYNRRPHSQLGYTGGAYRTPAEAYAAGLGSSVRMPVRETLDVLILPSATRKVRNEGIQLDRKLYWHPDLIPLIGQEVEIRFDPRNRLEVLVLRRGKFVAWAQEATGVAPFADTEEERDGLAAFLAGNAALRREYREKRKGLLARNPLAAMSPAARELTEQGVVVQMPHITGYDRATRAAARAQREAQKQATPPTPEQAKAVGELLVWEFQKQRSAEVRQGKEG
jgi:hypothetical protein